MKRLLQILLVVICAVPLFSQTSTPVLFYSDLDSGPATGGPGGNGAFVCVYGENFGSTGALTIGGATATIILWTDPGAPYVPAHYAKACGQIASSATSGLGVIQLTTTAGASNTLPFTIRSGNIYFVSPSGSDSTGDGSFGNPWATITNCKNTFSPGDICVAGINSTDTITVTTAEAQTWGTVIGLLLNSCGTPGSPETIVAYPGNSVTYDLHTWIDPSSNQKGGGRALEDYNSPSYSNNCGAGNPIVYWTIAGLTLNGNSFAAEFSGANFRVVDNTMLCSGAYCDGPSGGLIGGTGGNIVFYGNRVDQPGCGGQNTPCASGQFNTSKLYHSVYLGQGNNETLAYNEIIGGTACRGVQFHSPDSGGNPQQNIQIYNNVIHDTECDGLNLVTVNPSAPGGVNVYNNVVYNAGIGPNPSDGIAHYSCFYSPAYTGNGSCTGGGSGAINVYNNTFYNCGGVGLTDPGAIGAISCAPVTVALNNNLIVQPAGSGVPYLTGSSGTITATSNDCFGYSNSSGAAGCPAAWGGTEWTFDPLFVNPVSYDFHLNTSSQALSMSVTAPVPSTDADGFVRTSPNSLGAYTLPNSLGTNPSGAQPPQLTVTCAQVTYDGNPHSCTGSATGNGGVAVNGSWSFSPTSETSAGYYAVTGIFTSSDPNYSGGVANATLLIQQATPSISFTGAPASAPYRSTFTVLATTNASTTATIAPNSACTITGTTVTILAATGTCTLNATWAADNNYFAASASQSTVATIASPTITWATPAAITYGTALSAAQLNAQVSYNGGGLAGTFTYTPATGTVLGAGTQTLSVIFTPTNIADYTTASTSVTLQVNPATPKITWAAPAAITYGTALSSTQLDATSAVPGSFTYSPVVGTLLTAGTQTLSVTFTPTDTTDYNPATASVTVTVNKAAPTLAWAAPAAIAYGTALSSTQLNATASVPGAFVYSPAAGSVPSGGNDTLSVTFTPTDTADYTNATASVTLQVTTVTPTINWTTPAAITYGTAINATQLNPNATYNGATVAGTFVYTPPSGTVLGAGSQTLSAVFTPSISADYTTAAASVNLQVNPATPRITWATPAAITYGTAISNTQLNATASVPGTFVYSPAAGTVLTAGTQALSVTFTPTDTVDYATVTATTTMTVNMAKSTLTWAAPAAITYGTALSATQLNATASVPGSFAYSPAAGTVPTGGTQTLSVAFAPSDTTDYTTATATTTLTVNKAASTVSWTAPAAITYGTALSSAQLNATASVPGTFVYSPAAGAVLAAGTQTLSVTFTPTDTTDYTTATASANLQVNPATPTITWATPAAITYGTALSATQLSAKATFNGAPLAGTFAYTPATGTALGVGSQTLSVVFTPSNGTDYTSASASVTLQVNPATPKITWAVPAAITYGTAISSTQLNATASVPGSFAYSPAAGTLLTAGPQTLSVTFTPTNTTDYAMASASVTLQVNPATPKLTWTAPAAITYGTALSSTPLDAAASVPGSFAYSPAAGTVLTGGTHTLSVTFTPTDTTDYTTATATTTLTVSKAPPAITWATPAAIAYGTALSSTQLNATAPVPGSFVYSPAAGTVPAGGTDTLSVTFTPNDTTDYTTATVSVKLQVNPIAPTITWATPAAITYGTALSASQLNAKATYNGATVTGTFAYTPASGKILGAGSQTLSVVFTPTTTADYTTASASVTLQVNPATPKITWTAPAAIPYGKALSSTQLDATASVPGTFVYSPAAGTVLTAGTQTLSVTFTPTDSTDYTTATATVSLTVNTISSVTAITSETPNPSLVSQSVTVSFGVTGAAGVPTGTVNVSGTGGANCTATLSAGAGSCSLVFSASGSKILTASYPGDHNFKSSTSSGVTQVVQQ